MSYIFNITIHGYYIELARHRRLTFNFLIQTIGLYIVYPDYKKWYQTIQTYSHSILPNHTHNTQTHTLAYAHSAHTHTFTHKLTAENTTPRTANSVVSCKLKL